MIKRMKAIALLTGITMVSIGAFAAETYEPKSLQMAPARVHNYLEVAYDVEPYQHLSVRELTALTEFDNSSGSIGLLTNNEVDPHWITTVNIFQATILKSEWGSGRFKTAFMGLRYSLRFWADDVYSKDQFPPNLPNILFPHWKCAAWVHPTDAEALAYSLRHGYKGRVPVNPEWSDYWDARAKLLRNSPQWYIPKDTSAAKHDQQFDINKLYGVIKQRQFSR